MCHFKIIRIFSVSEFVYISTTCTFKKTVCALLQKTRNQILALKCKNELKKRIALVF